MYIVTFRIADRVVGGKNYQQRYDGLMERISQGNNGLWFDTTSFFVVGSSENTFQFGARIAHGLSAEHDMIFLFDPEDMSACYFGNLAAPEVLESFFPEARNLG